MAKKKNTKVERFLPTPAEMLEMFTIKNNNVNEVVPTKDPNQMIRKHHMNDVTPIRKKGW